MIICRLARNVQELFSDYDSDFFNDPPVPKIYYPHILSSLSLIEEYTHNVSLASAFPSHVQRQARTSTFHQFPSFWYLSLQNLLSSSTRSSYRKQRLPTQTLVRTSYIGLYLQRLGCEKYTLVMPNLVDHVFNFGVK